MAFSTGALVDPQLVGAGEKYGDSNIVLTARTFTDGLIVGRFAQFKAGSLANCDGTATPTIAGVVLRNVAADVESNGTVDGDLYSQVEYVRAGLISVDVVAADTPAFGGAVYIENQTAGQYGKATTVDAGNVAAEAEFIEEVSTNVWLVRLK